MKKFFKACFSVLLILVSFISLTACGKKASQVKIDLPETINLTEVSSPNIPLSSIK